MGRVTPPPQNLEMEKQILALIMYAESLQEAKFYASSLKTEWFTAELHRRIYAAIRHLIAEDRMPDVLGVSAILPDDMNGIVAIGNTISSNANIEQRFTEFRVESIRRQAVLSCEKYLSRIRGCEHLKVESEVLELEKNVHQYCLDIKGDANFTTKDTLKKVADLIANPKEAPLVSFRTNFMDKVMPVYRGQLCVIGARPSIGKTALALTTFVNQVMAGDKVSYFCGETDKEELVRRMISIISKVPYKNIIEGTMNPQQQHEAAVATRALIKHSNNFWVLGQQDYRHNPASIIARVKNLKLKYGRMDMVYIDHLHNMRNQSTSDKVGREEIVGNNVRDIKNIAIEEDCAVCLLCQINRDSMDRERPNQNNLKYSGVIEEEAHVVAMLHRPLITEDTNPMLETEFYSCKTRTISPFNEKILFRRCNAEYVGAIHAHKYNKEDLPDKAYVTKQNGSETW